MLEVPVGPNVPGLGDLRDLAAKEEIPVGAFLIQMRREIKVEMRQEGVGSVPPPEVLGAYTPDIADRIVTMTEVALAAEIELDKKSLDADVKAVFRGQCFALAGIVFALLTCIAIFMIAPNAAGATAVVALAAGLGVIIYHFVKGKDAEAPTSNGVPPPALSGATVAPDGTADETGLPRL